MLSVWQRITTLVSDILTRSRPRCRLSGHDPIDWLPPVLGPHDWPVGRMADRSACWYLEKDEA